MIKLAGAGPGNPKYLTRDVYEEILRAEKIVAFGRVAESLKDIRQDIVPVKMVGEVLDHVDGHEDLLILASGDPTFYGLTNFLTRKGLVIDEILPGLSSFQYMVARLKKPWQNANLISLHGREDSLESVRESELTISLTDKVHSPDYISKKLYEMGIRGRVYAGYNLSYPEEKIIEGEIGSSFPEDSPLAVVVIENEMD